MRLPPPREPRGRRTTSLLWAGSVLLVVAAGLLFWLDPGGGDPAGTGPPAGERTPVPGRDQSEVVVPDEEDLPEDRRSDVGRGPSEDDEPDEAEPSAAPAPLPPSFRRLRGMVIGIDPASDATAQLVEEAGAAPRSSACTRTSVSGIGSAPDTHEVTFAVARRLQLMLERAGATVVLGRADDEGAAPCFDERAEVLERADVVILLDAGLYDDGPGVRHARSADAETVTLATTIARVLGQKGAPYAQADLRVAGVRAARPVELLALEPPTVHVELGSPAAERQARRLEQEQRIARWLGEGIAAWAAARRDR